MFFSAVKNEYIYIVFFISGRALPPPLIRAMPERKNFPLNKSEKEKESASRLRLKCRHIFDEV